VNMFLRRFALTGISVITIWAVSALANTEKAIFLGPAPIAIPLEHPNIDDLHLARLSPSKLSFRTRLEVSFPPDGNGKGTESWYLLHGLKEGQRYEVRICWAATVCLKILH
jgi:hypothetical protein